MLLTFLLSLCLSFSAATAHDFHVSLTELVYQDQEVQATIKVFADDLQRALEEQGSTVPLNQKERAKPQVEAYLKKFFMLRLDGQQLPGTLLGYEQEVEVIYIYYALPLSSLPKALTIENRLFFELFEDQSHIVNFKTDQGWASVFLSHQKPKAVLNL